MISGVYKQGAYIVTPGKKIIFHFPVRKNTNWSLWLSEDVLGGSVKSAGNRKKQGLIYLNPAYAALSSVSLVSVIFFPSLLPLTQPVNLSAHRYLHLGNSIFRRPNSVMIIDSQPLRTAESLPLPPLLILSFSMRHNKSQ